MNFQSSIFHHNSGATYFMTKKRARMYMVTDSSR